MLPNFVHLGVPKSGSATISNILRKHPQVYTPRPKELNFFNDDQSFSRGVSWYQTTYFPNVERQKIICDNSIGYSSGFSSTAIERIRDSLGGQVKILLTLRHPVDRAYSQYCMTRYKGQFESFDFTKAVQDALLIDGAFSKEELERAATGTYYSNARDMSIFRHAMYLVPGMYANLLQHCRHAFGDENVLVLFTEDMGKNLPEVMNQLYNFLGIDSITIDAGLRQNESQTLRYPWLRRLYNKIYAVGPVRRFVSDLTLEDRKKLRRFFMSWNYRKNEIVPLAAPEAQALLQGHYLPQILKLQELTGRDLSNWIDKYPVNKANE